VLVLVFVWWEKTMQMSDAPVTVAWLLLCLLLLLQAEERQQLVLVLLLLVLQRLDREKN
jgi:4-amino-4-deoxy-L-arabinose transferase-like glycosyltransferase